MPPLFADLFGSKKFRVFLAGLILLVGNDVLRLGITPETADKLVMLVVGYLGAQGVADAFPGKEKVKAEAATVDAQLRLAKLRATLNAEKP